MTKAEQKALKAKHDHTMAVGVVKKVSAGMAAILTDEHCQANPTEKDCQIVTGGVRILTKIVKGGAMDLDEALDLMGPAAGYIAPLLMNTLGVSFRYAGEGTAALNEALERNRK